ncbi:MAG: hypothetical protein QOJ19_3980 [Acidimicrobiia bacterium]|nr:hypothetical protein [Acidimicrobiia bacterium]
MVFLHALSLVIGLGLAVVVVDSAVRTFVVPRGTVSRLTRLVFSLSRRFFELFAKPSRTYRQRDRVMALYAPLTLLALPVVWLIILLVGFAAMFWGWEGGAVGTSVRLSGSSLLTLGFERPAHPVSVALVLSEATLGLAVLALLISYLPTMYGTFSRREAMVTQLSVRAGTPPAAVEFLERAHLSGFLLDLDRFFEQWEGWFEEVEETHTSLGSLSFFRSPNPDRSWITAAGCVLDTASLRLAILDIPYSAQPAVCIRSGYLALRAIAAIFDQPFDPDPPPDGVISIAREEFDDVRRRLAASGLPLKADVEQAWRDFQGWRVNYDEPLLRLSALFMAPYAPWSSDRSLRRQLPRVMRRSPRRVGDSKGSSTTSFRGREPE